jgi:hypothetical protein
MLKMMMKMMILYQIMRNIQGKILLIIVYNIFIFIFYRKTLFFMCVPIVKRPTRVWRTGSGRWDEEWE